MAKFSKYSYKKKNKQTLIIHFHNFFLVEGKTTMPSTRKNSQNDPMHAKQQNVTRKPIQFLSFAEKERHPLLKDIDIHDIRAIE